MAPELSVEVRVRLIFAEVLDLKATDPIHVSALLYDELAIDSLDLTEICQKIEQVFGIDEVEPAAAERWRSVGDVVRYVRTEFEEEFTQDEVDAIVKRAKELGAGPGLAFKMGQFKLSNYASPHNDEVLAQLIVNGWDEKWDLIHATHALIEFLSAKNL